MCDACDSRSIGLYRDGCAACAARHEARINPRAAARRYLNLSPDAQLAQTREWKATLDRRALALLRYMIDEEREQCLTA